MTKAKLLEQLKLNGVPDSVISAFDKVKRENFVPEQFQLNAYDDIPIPLSELESSLPQPSTLGLILQLLQVEKTDKILEVGSGSGYLLALISELTSNEIFGLELNPVLAVNSTKILAEKSNIHIMNRDGAFGLPQQAPFNKIVLSASVNNLGQVYQILDQLSDPGILVAPVNDSLFQIIKENRMIKKHEFPGFKFVKLKKNSLNL